jgi:hypothetical protein
MKFYGIKLYLMKILSNIVQFHYFELSVLQFLNLFGKISNPFKLQKFCTYNNQPMAIDKKVNIADT